MKKLVFGITGLTLGGAERVLVDLANKLVEEYEVTIFTLYAKGELEKELNQKVKVNSLYNKKYNQFTWAYKHIINPLKVLANKKSIYQKYIEGKYDVEISFLEGPISRIFSIGNNNKKIAWIHNDISNVFGKGLKSRIKRKLDEKVYLRYNKLIFVSKDNLEKFNKVYPKLKKVEKEVVYNYLDDKKILEKADETIELKFDSGKVNMLTVARLTKQKGIDRIIRIHKKLIDEGIKHNFYVIGDGPERETLEKSIKEYKIEESFYLMGKKENPYPYMKQVDYFCLLSNYEGYGMVLEEAKILGKEIIITDTAAREALINYKYKIILDNSEEAIYEGLKKVINNFQRNEFKIQSESTIKYNNENIIKQIERLIYK